jgi:hypothetical protein
MQSNEQDTSAAEQHNQVLKLISAVAYGDATVEDIVAQFKKEGVDILDLVIALVDRASSASKERFHAQKPINLQHFSKLTSPDLIAQTVHRVPKIPFVLNGTLYDPQDIRRFDGHELHLVASAGGEPILAMDDRAVIARWWELTYLSSYAKSLSSALQDYQYGGYQSKVEPQNTGGGPVIIVSPPPVTQGSSGNKVVQETIFYEHKDFQGDFLTLPRDRAYRNLTDVGRGFLGLGDWNDIISSVHLFGTSVCVLCEHIHFSGSTLTLMGGTDFLEGFGWNDRTSSMQTW